MMSSNPWYVAVGDTIAGPAPADLVIKGIEHRKVPPEAQVCEVGARRWVQLASVEAFHAAVVRSYPPPPPDSAEERQWLEQGYQFPLPSPLPRFDDPVNEPRAARSRTLQSAPEIDVEVVSDDPPASAIDWRDPFESYFLVGQEVVLPDERALIESLSVVPRDTLRHDEAMWNLALCLAYGSDALGAAAGRAFFEAIADRDALERFDWMRRALRSDGFVPSGIPRDAGWRALQRLRSMCPPSFHAKLS